MGSCNPARRNEENTVAAASNADNVAVWFEIPAANFERAVGFYEKVFDTRLIKDKFGPADMAIFPYEGPATSGAIMKGEGYAPGRDGAVVYLRSKVDLNVPLSKVSAAGGRVATPKTALPEGMGYFAHFEDSEGNRVGLHSME
jgi:predicted enzyme related to lactoylglutathione lyase